MGFTYNGEGIDDLAGLYTQTTYDVGTGEVVERVRRDGRLWLVHPCAGLQTTCFVTRSGHRLIHVEGRMSALSAADSGVKELASPELLMDGDDAVRRLMQRIGIELPPSVVGSVHRLDLAADVEFSDRHDGLRFLGALDTLDLPSCKRISRTGRCTRVKESVGWKNGSGYVARAYDKSFERSKDEALRGRVIRVEAQRRPRAYERLHPSQLGRSTLATFYERRFKVFNLDDLVVTPPFEAYYVLQDRIGMPMPGRNKDGSHKILTDRIAERMLGTVMRLLVEGDAAFQSKRTAQARRRELRQVGVVVDDTTDTVIEMGDVIIAAMGAWRDGA